MAKGVGFDDGNGWVEVRSGCGSWELKVGGKFWQRPESAAAGGGVESFGVHGLTVDTVRSTSMWRFPDFSDAVPLFSFFFSI